MSPCQVSLTDTTFPLLDGSKRKTKRYETKNYRSAMLQGWNKFCFTGGVMEASIRLPGDAHIGGLWPAFWLMVRASCRPPTARHPPRVISSRAISPRASSHLARHPPHRHLVRIVTPRARATHTRLKVH